MQEIGKKQDLLAAGNHTLYSVLVRYTPLRLMDFTSSAAFVYQLSILLLLAIFVLWFIRKGKKLNSPETADFALLMALIPLLAYTAANSFGALFIVVYIMLVHFRYMRIPEKVLAIAGLILTGGNIYDIWGPRLFGLFKDLAILSVGTVILIVALSMLRNRKQV